MCEALFEIYTWILASYNFCTSMRNKQVEFNPYIYTLSKLYRFGYGNDVFKYKTPGHYSTGAIIRRYTVSCRFIEN